MSLAPYLLCAYLIGSIPFAVVVTRLMGLADPREYGSGNPGATNVLRSGNKLAAILTLLGDCLKGVVAVLGLLYLEQHAYISATGVTLGMLAVFLGHLFPVFIKFKGGKGVATALGVLLALDPLLGFATLVVWLVVALVTRYSSLAALVAAFCAPLFYLAPLMLSAGVSFNADTSSHIERALGIALMSFLLIIKHHSNIKQLIQGTESKIGAKK